MRVSQRVVIHLPITALWDEAGVVAATRLAYLDREQVRQRVQARDLVFVVAAPGLALHWVPAAQTAEFWKLDVKPHLVERWDAPIDIYHYPHGYAYIASEWLPHDPAEARIVLLEKHH